MRRDPLTVPFEHFFLRNAGAGENDIVLENVYLTTVANSVWGVDSNVCGTAC